jgi:hypothetical protein
MGVGGQRHALAALPPKKRTGTHCTAGWVDKNQVLAMVLCVLKSQYFVY